MRPTNQSRSLTFSSKIKRINPHGNRTSLEARARPRRWRDCRSSTSPVIDPSPGSINTGLHDQFWPLPFSPSEAPIGCPTHASSKSTVRLQKLHWRAVTDRHQASSSYGRQHRRAAPTSTVRLLSVKANRAPALIKKREGQ